MWGMVSASMFGVRTFGLQGSDSASLLMLSINAIQGVLLPRACLVQDGLL